ncbi:LPS export ABC transporter periplasmic protein LptC [bacterium]|nr:LPS export ABC transporter periplasmic protein LptC [bacterium]
MRNGLILKGRRRFQSVFIVILALFLYCGSLSAAAKNKEEAVDISSDRVDYSEKEKLVRLIGNVKFTCGETVMYASFAQYHTDTQIADFQGNIKLAQPGTEITGGKLRVYYGSQKAIFTDKVKIVTDKIKTDGSKTLFGAAYLEADKLDYEWETELGHAQGSIKFRQADKRIFADKAEYNGKSKTVELIGSVRFEQAKDDWLFGERVTVDLTDNSAKVSGSVMGRFTISRPDDEDRAAEAELPEAKPMEPQNPVDLGTVETLEPMSYPDL